MSLDNHVVDINHISQELVCGLNICFLLPSTFFITVLKLDCLEKNVGLSFMIKVFGENAHNKSINILKFP